QVNGSGTIETTPLPGTTGGIIVAKLSGTDGHPIWIKRFGSGSGYEAARSVAVTTSGDVVVAGTFGTSGDVGGVALMGDPTSQDAFVAKLAGTDGGTIWAKGFGASQNDVAEGVSVDAAGDGFVTGRFGGMVNFAGMMLTTVGLNAFALKLNSAT